MSLACDLDRFDWWELTNTGEEPVNLYGYRWDDWPSTIGGGPTITNTVILQPGESVILMEGATPDDFIRWWGAENLPPNLQFIRYTANGLNDNQDSIWVWNPTAIGEDEPIDHVSFSWACAGASFWFDPEVCPVSILGMCCSVEGQCDAFLAANGCDVGSPGWTKWTHPCLTSVRREGDAVTLHWKAQPGSTCLVQYASSLDTSRGAIQWSDLGTFCFGDASGSAIHLPASTESQCFYRLVRMSPGPCGCLWE